MKKQIVFIVLLFVSLSAFSQEKKAFSSIMDIDTGAELKDVKIETQAVFFEKGSGNYRVPNKLKFGYIVFRCYEEGKPIRKGQLNEEVGEFVYVKKDHKNLVKKMKKGQKLNLTGTVFVNNNMGYKQSNFIVEKIELIDE